ncbi:MAG: hypothetical protein ACTHJS_17355 [Xanthobacteraceae bacterium]|jgi:hypothetical protein
MTDLHEASGPRYTAQIDSVGWIFAAVVVVIAAVAGALAYHGSAATIANNPVAPLASR